MIKHKWILPAEDNVNDADLAMHALEFEEAQVDVVIAHDGTEVLDCLRRHGDFFTATGAIRRRAADLHMPRLNGISGVEELKTDAHSNIFRSWCSPHRWSRATSCVVINSARTRTSQAD